jgi:uncharacterized protein (DUF111 family)
VTAALSAGAADAWLTPIIMKKGRPAHTVSILADAASVVPLELLLLRETGSLGVRRSVVARAAMDRSESIVDYGGQAIRVKHGPWGSKPEWDDVARAAAATGHPARTVAAAVTAAMRDQGGSAGGAARG